MISKVGHWYLNERATYIRVFGATRAPHFLPANVPDCLFIGELFYQTILQGYNTTLVKDKKQDSIPYSFHVGFYLVNDTSQAKQEGLSKIKFRFLIGRFYNHDPRGPVPRLASKVSSCWSYAHDKFEYEVFTETT
jgi:hypothetical protein